MSCSAPNIVYKYYSLSSQEVENSYSDYHDSRTALMQHKKKVLTPTVIPCGKCKGCKIKSSYQWGLRCTHEVQMHERACFITLTYDNEHLPKYNSLNKKDLQNFWKKLRKYIERNIEGNPKIRYYACGEYGTKKGRPHYHALIFGIDFDDKILRGLTPSGKPDYDSPALKKIWKKGRVSLGTATLESASYVARYSMKKTYGKNKDNEDYRILDPNDSTGYLREINKDSNEERFVTRQPEFTTMSTNRGIGYTWLDTYLDDVYPKDEIYSRDSGRTYSVPRYYDKLLEQWNYELYMIVKSAREYFIEQMYEDKPELKPPHTYRGSQDFINWQEQFHYYEEISNSVAQKLYRHYDSTNI